MHMEIKYQIDGVAPDPSMVVRFEWSEQDPAAVRAVFHGAGTTEAIVWTFGRELLADGITSIVKVGLGDVRVQSYDHAQFKIFLSSPEGQAEIMIHSQPVLDFLQDTERLIPTAFLDGSTEESKIISELDSAIDAILSQTGREN